MADNNIDPEVIRELTEKYEQMRDAIANMIPAMVLSTTAINQMIAASKGLTVSEKEGTDVVKEYIKSITEATAKTDQESKAKEKSTESWNRINSGLNNAGASLTAFGSALLSSTNSMSKYQSSVTASAKGLTDLVGTFVPPDASVKIKLLFKGFTAVIDVLSYFVGAVFKQQDAMIKSFDSLSEVGATSALTTDDIRKMGLNAGYTSDRLEKFTDITKGLGTDLLGLGTTAGKGVEQFSKVATVSQDVRDSFNRLGIGQEELTKIQANYVKTTISSGRALARSPELLQQQSLKYATTLQELAALTGMNRDAQQKTLDEANANLNFQVHMYELGKKEAMLRDQNTEASRAQADAIRKQIDNTNAVVIVSKKMNSALEHTATLQLIAGKTWTESSAGLASKMPGLLKLLSRLDKGEDITIDFMDGMANATEAMLKAAGGAFKIGEAGPEIAKALGVSVESIKFLAEYRSKDANQRRLALEQIRQEIAARKAGKGAIDESKNVQNEQLKTELAAKRAMDELTATITGPVLTGFKLLLTGVMYLGKAIAYVSKAAGGPDISHLFKTPEELQEEIKNIATEIKDLESELVKATEIQKAKNKVTEDLNKKEKELQEAQDKARAMGRSAPSGLSKEETESWKKQRDELDALIRKITREKTALATKQEDLVKQSPINPTYRLNDKLLEKRKELEQSKKQAASMGVQPTDIQKSSAPATPVPPPKASTQKMEERALAASRLGTTAIPGTNERQPIKVEDVLAKIRFKDKKENTGGGEADPKLVDIAQKINDAFPGSTITALNDKFHQNLRDKETGKKIFSKHQVGKALDFKLSEKPTKEQADIIREKIRDLGASKVLDEYYEPSKGSTGDHFHVEVMKDGGIIKANPGGTLVQAAEAGMNEAFVPLPNGKSIPVTIPGIDKLTNKITEKISDKFDPEKTLGLDKLTNKITEKISDKFDPEKMLINLLAKNIPGLSKAMTMANIANTAGSSEISNAEKILEIAKMLNPTVRLVSKLYDTYQAVSSASFSEKPNTEIPDVNGIISARAEQQQVSDQELITKLSTALTSTSSSSNDNSASMNAMVEMLAEKLDSMNNKLETSNDIQDNLLKYSKI